MTATTPMAGRSGAAGTWDGDRFLGPLGEVTFTLMTVIAVVGLQRLFEGGDWVGPLLLHAVAVHAVAAFWRRRAPNPGTATAATIATGLVAIAWIHAGDATTFGIPTGSTIEALTTAVSDAFAQFSEVKAPTAPLPGFQIALAGLIWLSVAVADWAAFRLGAVVEALLPSTAVFAIGAALGADRNRVALAGAWALSVGAFVLVRRAARLGAEATWVGDVGGVGVRALIGVGVALLAAAATLGVVVAPRLPGADADPVVSLTDIGKSSNGKRVTVSPLVDIRSRLVDQADVTVFTVTSDVRAYWRLTSLDQFDGRIWASNGSYGKATGTLDEGVPSSSPVVTATQHFEVAALSQIWLPAAYEPRSVDVEDAVRYDEVSGTLIVDTDVPTSNGTSYDVVSWLPVHDPNRLAGASPAIPTEIADQYLGLPVEFPPSVRALAAEITGGAGSGYEAALRLQNHLRNNFTYDLNVGPGHSTAAIEHFLFESRRGYCEQFAGSFAAMARSIGLPARVAVGFTPGTAGATPNAYVVRGENAHAWPEVYLGEFGWVAFEPTPGRGAPFASQYTGVTEQQAQPANPAGVAQPATPPSTAPPASPDTTAAPPTTTPRDRLDDGTAVTAAGDPAGEDNPWPIRIATAVGILVGAVLLYGAAVTAVIALRRSRRRRAATTPAQQTGVAWIEALEALGRVGVDVSTSRTQRETARLVAATVPAAAPPVEDLAMTTEAVLYREQPLAPDVGAASFGLADEVERAVESTLTGRQRLTVRFHPRRFRR